MENYNEYKIPNRMTKMKNNDNEYKIPNSSFYT